MSKFKKIFATMVGTAMSANVLLTMSFSVFADNISQTFEFDGYNIGYEVKNSWGNTDVISLTLTNTGTETIEDWMLYFDPNGEIQYVNDAVQMTTTNGIEYIKNPGYNADIDPGASVEFRYAVNDCEEIPSDYKFCQSRMTKETGYDVSLKVNYTWGNNNEYFNGEIIIQNDTDTPIEAWELKADTNFTITEITNSWAADVTELESYNYMLKGTYTSIIPVGGSISLGFNGMKEGEAIISDYSLTEVIVDESVINSIINDSNKDDEFYDDCIDWSTLPDFDEDGLPDEYEEEYGCDPVNPDTDGDGLPDGYEIMTIGSNPADAYSLDSTLSDGEYDNDQDELSNYEEYLLGTDPLRADSDFDGLSDGDEVNVYGTDPLIPDTDGDGLSDGDEIALGLNPLVTDSNGDGILDNEEKFSQDMTYNNEDADTVIDSINVSFEGTGYINSTTSVENIMDTDWMCSNVVGLVGAPYDISSDSSFDTATLTFTVDKSSLDDAQFDDLAVLWYNEEEQRFVEMETISDVEASTLTTTVEHFSKYLIVDCSRWYEAWSENNYPINGNTLHTAITIDCSSSMIGNDPNNYRITAANSFVDVMNAADLASVIFFADGADEKQELTNNQEALKNAIDDVFSAGTTNYTAALRYSIDSLEKQPDSDADDIIIFLSDGRPTGTEAGPGYEIPEEDFDYSLVDEAASKGIRIYTIGLTNHVNENILKEMASRTNGEYYYANTAKELIAYFLTVNMGEKYDITTDTDEDGIPDLFETYGMPVANGQVIFSDPEVKDTDGDGLEDGEEVIMHVVDNADEVKAAYNYMYDYIPDIFISENGGIYFTMVADPEDEDTDDDGILDEAEKSNLTADSRYDNLDPLRVDTIESLFPELTDITGSNQENNAVYLRVEGNNITIRPRIKFDGCYDLNAFDNIRDDRTTCNESMSIVNELNNQCTFADYFINALNRRWSSVYKSSCYENVDEYYQGTLYDFYPGLKLYTTIEPSIITEVSDHNTDSYINVIFTLEDGSSTTGWNGTAYGNRVITMKAIKRGYASYQGSCAHEFGHALNIADAYPGSGQNKGFTSAFSKDSNSELYCTAYGLTGGGEVMYHNGDVLANDIEMMLLSLVENKEQYFTADYNRDISLAIKENRVCQYSAQYYNIDNQPYVLGVNYVWHDEKGYIPEGVSVETIEISGASLQYYEENSGAPTITILGIADDSYNGSLIIPEKINGCPVTRIADGAFAFSKISSITFEKPENILSIGVRSFYKCENLESVEVLNNVNIILPSTFEGCSKLSKIIIPDSVKYIESLAFSSCTSLTNVKVPESVNEIGYRGFYLCENLKEITLSEGLKTIGGAAFELCGLEHVNIPASVNNIGAYAFYACHDLSTVAFNATSIDMEKYSDSLFWVCDNLSIIYVPAIALDTYNEWLKSYSNFNIMSFNN